MANCYLAQEASRKSGKYVVEGARQAWLDLFADDALVQDPVGVSPLDPSRQESHRGVLGHGDAERDREFRDPRIAPGG